MTLSIIVAVSENNLIGVNNDLPWHLSADLKRMKTITMGHHLIMGRKTFESLGKPLPGRTSIIITRNKNYQVPPECIVVPSLKEALAAVKNDNEPFIVGGGEIFREALPLVNKIYLTRIHQRFEGDTYFPELNEKEWKQVSRNDFQRDEKNNYAYSFINLERIRKS
nr:Dihydrofolate reductase [uncultured bacterium]